MPRPPVDNSNSHLQPNRGTRVNLKRPGVFRVGANHGLAGCSPEPHVDARKQLHADLERQIAARRST